MFNSENFANILDEKFCGTCYLNLFKKISSLELVDSKGTECSVWNRCTVKLEGKFNNVSTPEVIELLYYTRYMVSITGVDTSPNFRVIKVQNVYILEQLHQT
jgi:hypothetical protein